MPAIKLVGFRGEQPRIIPRQLPEAGAQAALNCRLDDGGLTPIRQSLTAGAALADNHTTIYRFGEDWLSWAGTVHAAEGPVDDTRLYYTGDGAPKMFSDGVVYALAIAPPTPALTATLGGVGAGDIVTRLYVYTWVTSFGEESEPCAASNEVDWQPGNDVTLSGFAATPPDREITKQRIYRSQTGQSGTYFYLIAERTAAATDYVDTVPVDGFQEPLPSADWNAPPAGLAGLVAMSNGMMAAYVGRRIYWCEPYRPHAWPEKYSQNVDADIVGLAAIGTTLFIFTKGTPHFATGATPDAMRVEKSPAKISCINGRGIANLGFGVAFPGNEGLALARVDGSVGYVSGPLFDRDDWLAYSPSTMVGCQHQGQYVGFYDVTVGGVVSAGALIIDVGNAPFLIRSSIRATAAFYDEENGALYYARKDSADIDRFDDPTGARSQLYWKSKQFILPYPENFGVIKIDADLTYSAADLAAAAAVVAAIVAANQAMLDAGSVGGEVNGFALNGGALNGDLMTAMPPPAQNLVVGVYADGIRVAEVEATNVAKRLPSGFKAEKWEIDVTGDIAVTQIVMAKTMEEIKQVA